MSFTPAQVAAIKGWTEQRDALLADIRVASIELDEKQKASTEAGQNLAALHVSIGEANGRIAELMAFEERTRTSLPLDIIELEARKTRLESECAALDARGDAAHTEYALISGATSILMLANDTMKDQAAIVKSVTGDIIELSKTHLGDAKTIMLEVSAIANKVIDRGNENVKQAGIVIEKMPKIIFDMQRPIPVRRTYPPGHPHAG